MRRERSAKRGDSVTSTDCLWTSTRAFGDNLETRGPRPECLYFRTDWLLFVGTGFGISAWSSDSTGADAGRIRTWATFPFAVSSSSSLPFARTSVDATAFGVNGNFSCRDVVEQIALVN